MKPTAYRLTMDPARRVTPTAYRVSLAKAMTEDELRTCVIELAESTGWRIYHVADVRGRLRSGTSVGFPDLVLVRDRVLYRELKSHAGPATDDQRAWLKCLWAAGQDAGVWRPMDWLGGGIERELQRKST